MGNLSYISSKTNLGIARIQDDLEEINERRFGGFFNLSVPYEGGWDIGYTKDGEHKRLWEFHLTSTLRKIGGKSPRPNYHWAEWAWCVFQAELAAKWGGRLSCEGVPKTWSPESQLEWCGDLAAYLKHRYSWMKDDDPGRDELRKWARDQTVDTMPKELYPYAFPNPEHEMRAAVEKMAADLGIEISFDRQESFDGYRRGERLTMGELRALEDGAVVWLYIYYKESVRADDAYRIERRDGCWMFDDGSSFGADLVDEGDDDVPAGDEWSEVYRAVRRIEPAP